MMDSFYYTLQSNASKDIFPSNTCTNFTVRLPQRMTLSGQWVVGLAEIHFPIKFEPHGSKRKYDEILTANTAENEIDVDEKLAKHDILSKELISEIDDLNHELKVLSDAVTKCSVDNPGEVEKCKVIKKLSADVLVRIKEAEAFINTNNRLQKMERVLQVANKFQVANKLEEDCSSRPKYLYIYCDAAELEFIGDKYAPFLRVARVPPSVRLTGETEDKDWVNPHYKKVSRSNFDTLEVDIRCEKGFPVSFAEGVVIVTLHFKRVL
jgi:hypothetical protein